MVGIYPNDAALIRLAASLLVEQNDEWLVARRYLSQDSLAALYPRTTLADEHPATIIKIKEQELPTLTPA